MLRRAEEARQEAARLGARSGRLDRSRSALRDVSGRTRRADAYQRAASAGARLALFLRKGWCACGHEGPKAGNAVASSLSRPAPSAARWSRSSDMSQSSSPKGPSPSNSAARPDSSRWPRARDCAGSSSRSRLLPMPARRQLQDPGAPGLIQCVEGVREHPSSRSRPTSGCLVEQHDPRIPPTRHVCTKTVLSSTSRHADPTCPFLMRGESVTRVCPVQRERSRTPRRHGRVTARAASRRSADRGGSQRRLCERAPAPARAGRAA